ncbi:MAG: hypothetical protein ACR2RL_06395, partial [Gammaproteobacteria bacterium]
MPDDLSASIRRVLDDELEASFRGWYPGFRPEPAMALPAFDALRKDLERMWSALADEEALIGEQLAAWSPEAPGNEEGDPNTASEGQQLAADEAAVARVTRATRTVAQLGELLASNEDRVEDFKLVDVASRYPSEQATRV